MSLASPVPLSRLLYQGIGLMKTVWPSPTWPTASAWPTTSVTPGGDPLFEILGRTMKTVLTGLATSYFNLSVQGLENVPADGAAIIVGNHPSLIDGVLLFVAMPRAVRFIVHEDLAAHPLLKWISDGMGYLPMHHHAVHAAEAALAKGDLTALFPEGWVWDRGTIRTWKPGAAVLALHSGAPVIPLGIAGSDMAWPGATLMPLPTPIALSFGPPRCYPATSAGHVPAEQVDTVLSDLRHAISEQVEKANDTLHSQPDHRSPWLIGAAAVMLLPMVLVLTLTSPRMD